MSAVAVAERERVLEPAPVHRPHKRWTRFILPVYTIGVIGYLASPVFLMILYGFNDIPGERQSAKFFGFTLDWYRNLFAEPSLTDALKRSIWIAVFSAIGATVLGTFIGIALGRHSFRGRSVTNFIIFLAIAVPEIVLGASLLSMFVNIQFPLGFFSILVSHIGFGIAFVAVTVRARVDGLDRSLENAAQDLFATPAVAFFKVTLPLILPGIVAGFLLAFVLSLDDFVITAFVRGPVQTFPIWVYGASRIGIPPQVNVMGTLLFGTGVLLAALNVVVASRGQRKTGVGVRAVEPMGRAASQPPS